MMAGSYYLHTDKPTLIFDVGGVLLRHDAAKLKHGCVSRCEDKQQALRVWSETIESGHLARGEVSVTQFYWSLVTRCGLQLHWDEFSSIWNGFFEHEPGAQSLASRLKSYRLVLLSNTNQEHWRHMLATFPVLSCFDRTYLSYELRMAKPDPELYSAIVASEGVRGSDCIFFDDSPQNVRGARDSGWAAHVCNGVQAVIFCLKQYGILS